MAVEGGYEGGLGGGADDVVDCVGGEGGQKAREVLGYFAGAAVDQDVVGVCHYCDLFYGL